MKTIKLLFASVLLFCTAGVWAQEWTDVTSTYITNADLKDISADATTDASYWPVYTTGRTAGKQKHPKNWYLHTNGTKDHNGGGEFFECWAADQGVKRWTLFQDITLPAGTYKLTGQYSTDESRGIIKTVAITPHHSYFSTGITSSNWGSWGSETVEFTIYEGTKVRVGMIANNFAQCHGFTLTTTGAKQLLADEIAAAPTGVSTTTAQSVYDDTGSNDAAYRSAAKTLHDAIVEYNIENASEGSPVDMTDYITDPSFEGIANATPYTESGHTVMSAWSHPSCSDGGARSMTGDNYLITDNSEDGFYAVNLWDGSATTYYVQQTISELPVGCYVLTATYASDASNTATLSMASSENTITATGKGHFVEGSVTYYHTATGNVTIKLNSSSWFKADNFTLSYKGAIQNTPYSVELESATAVTNDKWYAVDIPVAGNFSITSSVNNTVKYTQDGYKIPSDISTSVNLTAGVKQVLSLTEGTLYVLAENNATLTVAYTYNVGVATTSVADNEYTQSNTMTFTYASASTNNPGATFSILDASKIKVNDVAASASIEGKVLTVTLASPIDTSTDYAVSIEAGAVGYNAGNANAAISLTAKTPAAFDGFYFLRTTTNKYVSRGGDYNSRAIVDEFGLPLSVATDASGITQFTYVDNGGMLFLNGEGNAYTDDDDAPDWTAQATEGGFYLIHANEGSYKDKKLNVWTGDNKSLYATTDEGTVFIFEPVSEHNTHMEALKDAQAATAASAAGNDGITSKSALETWLAANYNAVNVSVPTVLFAEKWNGDASAAWDAGKDMYTNTVSSLPEGLYKLTVNAFYRLNENPTAADGARGNTYLYGGTAKTQLYSLKDFPAAVAWPGDNKSDSDGYYPNDLKSGTAATASSYLTELYVYHTGGDFTYGIHQPSRFSNKQWFGYQNFTLTRYESTMEVTVTSAGYATYASDHALDFTDSSIKAYIAKTKGNGTGVTFTQIKKVPAGTGVLLYKDGGTTDNIPIFDGTDADGVTGNVFVRGTGANVATDDGTNYNYILNNKLESGIGFYKANGQKVATNRAYISILQSESAGVKEFFSLPGFEDNETAIENVNANVNDNNAVIYNVAGQRISKMQKGINIVNGKKILK